MVKLPVRRFTHVLVSYLVWSRPGRYESHLTLYPRASFGCMAIIQPLRE